MSLVAVHLYGPLADKYGARHDYAIGNPAEAVAALDANHPGFVADFARSEIYYILADGDWRDGDQAAILPVSREVHLVPRIEGEGPVIAALIAPLLGAFGAITIAGTTVASIIGGILFTGLMIGVSFLLAPKAPKMDQEDTKKDENFAFTGPANVTEQGTAVPLVYGRVHCGSVVISASLEPQTQHVAASPAPATGFPPTPPTNTPSGGVPLPPGGYPPINIGSDPPWSWKPHGWILSKTEQVQFGGVTKMVRTFSPPSDNVLEWNYAWTGKKGYYVTPQVETEPSPEDDEWAPGDHG